MFFAIPLANKPTWHAPPWMTVLIIVINMLVYWGWQAPEERAVERSAEHYALSGLAELEVPHYIHHLEQQVQQAPGHPARTRRGSRPRKDPGPLRSVRSALAEDPKSRRGELL
jgi:hypothetical protein